jgi:hypothetical protein
MKQFTLTPSAGKRLIGKGMAASPVIKSALKKGTIVIVAGTTNSYVAEEILALIGEKENFSPRGFYRGITLPPGFKTTTAGRLADESKFPGDVVIRDGVWQKGKTVYDVADSLREGDIILKGANALDITHRRASVLIGNPQGGTTTVILPAVVGRKVRLIIPVGLEKRIFGDLDDIAKKANMPGTSGMRLLPVPGEIFTEIDSLSLLCGVAAELIAAGGVSGAEGSVWLSVDGTAEQELAAEKILGEIASEPAFVVPQK